MCVNGCASLDPNRRTYNREPFNRKNSGFAHVRAMTQYIHTADDGRITDTQTDTPEGEDWIEITELAYLSDAAPDGHEAIRYYKPDAEEPDEGWGIESETLGKVFVEA